jgi:hypothetical protein
MHFVFKITHLCHYEELTKTTLLYLCLNYLHVTIEKINLNHISVTFNIINLFASIKKLSNYPIVPAIMKN